MILDLAFLALLFFRSIQSRLINLVCYFLKCYRICDSDRFGWGEAITILSPNSKQPN
ncbi:MAG TPA: hypothetical protein V6D25_21280 [Leptolyngbyaceae cyanobacterium]